MDTTFDARFEEAVEDAYFHKCIAVDKAKSALESLISADTGIEKAAAEIDGNPVADRLLSIRSTIEDLEYELRDYIHRLEKE